MERRNRASRCSYKTVQLFCAALAALLALAVLRPGRPWSAIFVVMAALVLVAELINTALEAALDGLHPEHARFVQIATDCAAAAG